MKSVVITGITGSGGSYLADYILENHPDVEVHGICRWHSTSRLDNIEHIKNRSVSTIVFVLIKRLLNFA